MNHIITGSGSILLSIEGYSYTIPTDHPMYTQIRNILAKEDANPEVLIEYVDFKEACAQYGIMLDRNGDVYLVNGENKVWVPEGKAQLAAGVALGNIALKLDVERTEL